MTSTRILIVDDHGTLRKTMAEYLRRQEGVEEVLEAVEGINASMKIRIYKVITPSEDEYPIDAYVYSKGKTSIGGELTPVAYYTRIPHYPGDWKKGTLQYVPTSIHEKGRPTVLRAGDEVTFIINNDMSTYRQVVHSQIVTIIINDADSRVLRLVTALNNHFLAVQ